MKARKRGKSIRRDRATPLSVGRMAAMASTARYTPSKDHKDHWTPELGPGRWRGESATPCPLDVSRDQAEEWLRRALANGQAGQEWPQDGAYPQYVWIRVEETVFEGRLSEREQGWYHGYPLDRTEWPSWL